MFLPEVHSNTRNQDGCSSTLQIDIDQAGLYAGFSYNTLYIKDYLNPMAG